MQKKDTKTRILDAAEKIIVKKGADKASLRSITKEAGVNLAAINYHFGSKNNLVSAITARYIDSAVEDLKTRLDKVLAKARKGEAPVLEDLIRSYLLAYLEFSMKNPDYKNVFNELFRSYDDETAAGQTIKEIVGHVMRDYAEAFKLALPELSEESVLERMAFFRSTAIGIMAGECVMDASLDMLGISKERNDLLEGMICFIAAGFRA